MYGFGDDQNPYSESVDLLEDLVIEYINEMVFPSLLGISHSTNENDMPLCLLALVTCDLMLAFPLP